MNYIIVQAGGKGTRLGYLTKNKPKCLAPVENLPMLFHLFHEIDPTNGSLDSKEICLMASDSICRKKCIGHGKRWDC